MSEFSFSGFIYIFDHYQKTVGGCCVVFYCHGFEVGRLVNRDGVAAFNSQFDNCS